MPNFDLGDYVDVNERLAWFFDRYPEGSLQADILERGEGYVVIKALAYRSPMDDRPGSGMASEPIPGRTPYTKDSEIMVGETSAWGRALAAIGAPTKGSIASKQEAANRTSGAEAGGVSTDSPAQDPAPGTTSGEGREPMMTAGAQSAESTTETASTKPSPGTTSVYGEVAGKEPGEGQPKPSPGSTTKDAPGPPNYPLTPAECSHLNSRSGRLLGPRSSPRGPVCPRCGLSYITVTESTSADLGSA